MRTAKIEKIYQLHIWVERDFCGSNHIMMQHEGFGEPFCYAQLHYSYAYTSNSTIHTMTEKFMELLGVEAKDIVWKSRGFEPLKWWMKAIMPIFNIYWKFKLGRLRKAQEHE